MTYNPNIPQASDDPTDSQLDLLNNFTKINADFSINHIALTSGAFNGLHTKVQFPTVLSVNPDLASPQSSLYTKTGVTSLLSELFFQNGNGAAFVKQLTNLDVTSAGTNFGFTTPWGWIINCGQSAASPITFQVPYPVGPTFYTAQLTGQSATIDTGILTLTNTGMTYATDGATTVFYLVIGSST